MAEVTPRIVSTVGFNEGDVKKRMVSGGNFITVESVRAVVRDVP